MAEKGDFLHRWEMSNYRHRFLARIERWKISEEVRKWIKTHRRRSKRYTMKNMAVWWNQRKTQRVFR